MVSSHVCHREYPSTIWECFLVGFVYPCQTFLRFYISSHPTLCLICRAGSHKYCYICLWSFLTALPAHPPVGHCMHTFSWFTFVFSLWKLSTLRVSSFCGCPGLPCSGRSFQIHHTGMPRRFASLYSSLQSSPPPPDNLCSFLTA